MFKHLASFNNMSIFDAVQQHDISAIHTIISHGKHLSLDSQNRTALFYATSLDVADILIENGVDIDHKDTHGYTALIYAKTQLSMRHVQLYLQEFQ